MSSGICIRLFGRFTLSLLLFKISYYFSLNGMAPCKNLLSVCFIVLRKTTSKFRLNIFFFKSSRVKKVCLSIILVKLV